MKRTIIISCEHGGNRVPSACRKYFRAGTGLLRSHRGFDAGALDLARALAGECGAGLYFSTVSRLVVDMNRSLKSRNLLGPATRSLDTSERQKILQNYYIPYRKSVEDSVERSVRNGQRVLHISVHSFTPVIDGKVRTADVGLLFDPSRTGEKEFCAALRREIQVNKSDLSVRMNYPYRGISDGMTSYLRKSFGEDAYIGIELEVNQKHLAGPSRFDSSIRGTVVRSVAEVIEKYRSLRNVGIL